MSILVLFNYLRISKKHGKSGIRLIPSHLFFQVSGEISYNGYKPDEFVPQKTSAYISQHDLHQPEITVRETNIGLVVHFY